MKYTGKDLDEDTGLYYFNARWYDANTGRFISEDPARDGSNWYVYVSNNPLGFIDPSGLYIIPTTRDYVQENFPDTLGNGPSTVRSAGCYLTANSRVIDAFK